MIIELTNSTSKIIHIDPSIDPFNKLDSVTILERVKELLLYCYEYSKSKNKEIFFYATTFVNHKTDG